MNSVGDDNGLNSYGNRTVLLITIIQIVMVINSVGDDNSLNSYGNE